MSVPWYVRRHPFQEQDRWQTAHFVRETTYREVPWLWGRLGGVGGCRAAHREGRGQERSASWGDLAIFPLASVCSLPTLPLPGASETPQTSGAINLCGV